jgi:hypothetical protein
MTATSARRFSWVAAGLAFGVVLLVQLWLVAGAGTDIPFQDQWEAEGRGLYPGLVDGSTGWREFFAPHNEHRIVWTKLLDAGLFRANGQWDPLVQLVAGALLHAAGAALLAGLLARGFAVGTRVALAALIGLFHLPFAGWHNALWGFQSQVYFVLLFGFAAFAVLGDAAESGTRRVVGWLLVVAAMLAMGAGLLVPVAILGVGCVRTAGWGNRLRTLWPAVVLVLGGWALRPEVPAHAVLQATDAAQAWGALLRLLAWPYSEQPWVAVVVNLPLAGYFALRVRGRLQAPPGEPFVALATTWIGLLAAALAWTRGGGAEFAAGVPSRYVDFLVPLPLLNAWAVGALLVGAAPPRRALGAAWLLFALAGWIGAALPPWHHILGPRRRDRDAPVRLVQVFQQSGSADVFAGQPRLLVPHPDPETVRAVLSDPRLAGHLPPSLQPARPPGPLSRATRTLLGR